MYNPETKIVSGLPSAPIYNKHITLGRVLLEKMNSFPNRIVQFCHEDQIAVSALAMATMSIRVAQSLPKYGVEVGDVVGVVGKNTTFVAPVVIGCYIFGAPVNPLDVKFEKDDIVHVFGLTKPKIVFCDHEVVDLIKDCLWELENPALIVSLTKKLENLPFVFDFFERIGDESSFIAPIIEDNTELPAVILCSSGTTGLSKGIQLSHAQCLEFQETPNVRSVVCFSSLYWLSGFVTLSSSIFAGLKRIITHQGFSPEMFILIVEKYRVEAVIAAPTHAGLLLRYGGIQFADFSSLRVVILAGGIVQEHLRNELQDYILNGRLMILYGMTEIGGTATGTNPFERHSLTIGKPNRDIKIKVVDEEGNALNANETGEVWLQTKHKFLGYIGNEEANKDFIDEDNWIHTGDLGYYDDKFNFFIVDRKKDTLKYFGYQVSPSEIESVIEKIYGVELVCVVGIPDILLNDLVTAVIVKTPQSDLKEEDVLYECNEKLPEYKQVRYVFFVDEMPLTPSGKIKRRLVKDLALRIQSHVPEE